MAYRSTFAFNHRSLAMPDHSIDLATVALQTPLGSVRNHIRIQRNAKDVWDVIADAASIADWFPSFVSSRIEGRDRIIVTKTGLPVTEEILRVDHDQRRLQYAIKPGGPIKEHRGTVDVIGLNDESCLVIYSTDVVPSVLALAISAGIEEALVNLCALMESGAR
jgi:uncharacterized protein YndB with AHSA1/START domain